MSTLRTARLELTPLRVEDLDAFHDLVVDPHIRRFLLDGEVLDRAWCAAEIETARALEAASGVTLWLVRPRGEPGAPPLGFAGFKVFEGLHVEPELLYALRAAHTGAGLATEIAVELVRFARDEARLPRLVSAVDAPNGASIRVLEKVGFRRHGTAPGAFGDIVLFELPDAAAEG